MKALILCAGEGSRLRPLTYLLPKPLVPVAGVPMVVRQMLALKAAGITEVVINTAHGAARLEALLGDGQSYGMQITYSREGLSKADALETLGGIVKAQPFLLNDPDEAFLVVAGDIVTDYDYRELVSAARSLSTQGDLAHLVLVPNPDFHPLGDMGLEAGHVVREPRRWTFSSLGAYHRSLFDGLEVERAKLFPWLWQTIEAGRVQGSVYQGLWLNVGDFDELNKANQALCERGPAALSV